MDNSQSLFDQAVAAAQRKNFISARSLLAQLLKQEPNNINAWLLASHVVESRSDAIYCLQRALQLDPVNTFARQRLTQLQGQPPAPTPIDSSPAPRPDKLPDRAAPPANQPVAPRLETNRLQIQDSKPQAPKSNSRNGMLIFAGILVVVCCLAVAGVAVFSPDSPLLKPAEPTPSADQLFIVLYQNSRAANDENVAAYMATIHPNSPSYRQTESALQDMFSQYDLEFYFYDLQLISVKTSEARIHFSLSTRKIRGPAFRDNIVIGTMILKPDNGVWKIYNQVVDDVQY